MVVGQLPVVVALLALLLGGRNLGNGASQRVDDVALLRSGHLQPLGHVAALQALRSLVVNGVGQTLAGESGLADVAAPCYGVTLFYGVVDNLHHLVHRQVIAERIAPVVLHLDGEGGVEGVMRIRGDTYVVVPVETEAGSKRLRRVLLALVGERLGALAKVGIENTLQTVLPSGRQLLAVALGYGIDIGGEHGEELVEVVQRVTIQRAGERHGVLGADAVVLQHVVNVVGRATLCKLAVAMQANHLYGTVHVGLVGYERLAEVVGLARLLQDLSLEVGEGGVVPARARTVLVFDAGDGILLDDGEHGFVLVLGGSLLLGCRCTQRYQRYECESK